MSAGRATLVTGRYGYTLHYRPDEAAHITRKNGALFCWYCRKRMCAHTAELNTILTRDDEAA